MNLQKLFMRSILFNFKKFYFCIFGSMHILFKKFAFSFVSKKSQGFKMKSHINFTMFIGIILKDIAKVSLPEKMWKKFYRGIFVQEVSI